MTLRLELSRQARKFLDELSQSNRKHKRQVTERIALLLDQPLASDSSALVNLDPLRRVTSGEYRIVYHVEGDVLKIIAVGRRNDDAVYRLIRRQ